MPENFARIFAQRLSELHKEPIRVWHILPTSNRSLPLNPLGTTLYYGRDMGERRAILAQLCDACSSVHTKFNLNFQTSPLEVDLVVWTRWQKQFPMGVQCVV